MHNGSGGTPPQVASDAKVIDVDTLPVKPSSDMDLRDFLLSDEPQRKEFEVTIRGKVADVSVWAPSTGAKKKFLDKIGANVKTTKKGGHEMTVEGDLVLASVLLTIDCTRYPKMLRDGTPHPKADQRVFSPDDAEKFTDPDNPPPAWFNTAQAQAINFLNESGVVAKN